MYIQPRNVEFSVINKDIKEVYFKSPCPCGIEKVDRAKAFLYETQNPKGGIVFIHGTGDKNFNPLRFYPEKFKEKGYTTIMPVLPYHFDRTPEGEKSGSRLLKGDADEIGNHFEQCVTDILTCIDYLQSIGIYSINIVGISFGGMIAAIAAALDKRINKAALIVTGGNFQYITWESIATKVLRISYEDGSSCNREKCIITHLSFDNYAKNFNSIDDLNDMPPCFRYDPCIFAEHIPRENVIMFTAKFDSFIPRKSSNDLWEKLNKPKRYNLLSGHLTSHILYKHFILKKILQFFNS